jgi:DNA-binding MurR/RpiR family transcriptional regulator
VLATTDRPSKQIEAVLRLALSRPDVVAFSTVKTLAESASVSHASVMRAAKYLGFGSFTDFRNLFRQYVRAKHSGLETSN